MKRNAGALGGKYDKGGSETGEFMVAF